MNTNSTWPLDLAGRLLLVYAVALAAPPVARAQHSGPSTTTTVVNTPSNPVPVVQQGTASVNVTALPAVSIDPTHNTVKFDPSQREPILLEFNAAFAPGSIFATVVSEEAFTVPAGKRLVVEQVFARAVLFPDAVEGGLTVESEGADGTGFRHTVPFVFTRVGLETHVANLPLKLYLTPVDSSATGGIWFEITRYGVVGTNEGRARFQLAGYLEDAQ